MKRIQLAQLAQLHKPIKHYAGGEGTVYRFDFDGIEEPIAVKIYHSEQSEDRKLREQRISAILELDRQISQLPLTLQRYLRNFSAIPLALVEHPRDNVLGFAMLDVFAIKSSSGPFLAKDLMNSRELLGPERLSIIDDGGLREILITTCLTVAIFNSMGLHLPDISGQNVFIMRKENSAISFLVDIDSYFSPDIHDPIEIAEFAHWRNPHRPENSYGTTEDVWKIGLLARRLAANCENAVEVIHKNARENLQVFLSSREVQVVWQMCNNDPGKRPTLLEVIRVLCIQHGTELQEIIYEVAALLDNSRTGRGSEPHSPEYIQPVSRFLESIQFQTDPQARANAEKERFKNSIQEYLRIRGSGPIAFTVFVNPTSTPGKLLIGLNTRNALGKKFWESSSFEEFVRLELNESVEVISVGVVKHLILRAR